MLEDKLQGCFIGLAVGDALGTTNEFVPRQWAHKFDLTNPQYVGKGPFDLKPGDWTDDTSMALAQAESYVELGNCNFHDQMERYVDWMTNGAYSVTGTCFDIGNATAAALERYDGEPFNCGSKDPNMSGNGGIMRMAPTAIVFSSVPQLCRTMCVQQSSLTHASQDCLHCARMFGELLFRCFHDTTGDKASVLLPLRKRSSYSDRCVGIADMQFLNNRVNYIGSKGYVVDTLKMAIWCFANSSSFAECVAMAANLGDDADTNAAVAGQIAGAFYGLSAIPQHLVDGLTWSDRLLTVSKELIKIS